MESADVMDRISSQFCRDTECNDERMKSASGIDNCEWYHSGWLYCRMAGIIISKDFLEDKYREFFYERVEKNKINVLICGFADYAILNNIISVIPEALKKNVYFTLIDICQSPIELCKWYVNKVYSDFKDQISYIKADATSIPIEDGKFDLITSYSFLTRMSKQLMKKVINEWHRLLSDDGIILTTVRITIGEEVQENFSRSSSSSIAYGMNKVEEFIEKNHISPVLSIKIKNKAKNYLCNIMSSCLLDSTIKSSFDCLNCSFWYYDQPGELESTHKMMGILAKKGE